MTTKSIGLGEEKLIEWTNISTPYYAVELKLPQNVSDWMTSAEAFNNSNGIYGVPANLAVYRLVRQEPVVDLLERDGNLFASPEFCSDVYARMRSSGERRIRTDSYQPICLSEREREYILSAVKTKKSFTAAYSGLRIDRNGGVKVQDHATADEKRLFLGAFGTDSPNKANHVILLKPDEIGNLLSRNPADLFAMACYVNTDDDFASFVKGTKKRQGFLAAKYDFVHWNFCPG